MKNHIYKNCKALIIEQAKNNKKFNPKDKPYGREQLNNLLDDLIRQIDFFVMKETLTEKRANMYKFWLTNLTIQKH